MIANEIRNQIIDDVNEVWGVEKINITDMMVSTDRYPRAVIRLDSIERNPNGIQSTQNIYNFQIIYADKWNSGDNVEELKLAKAELLRSKLEANPKYAGGYSPYVTAINFTEGNEEPAESVYMVRLDFMCSDDDLR